MTSWLGLLSSLSECLCSFFSFSLPTYFLLFNKQLNYSLNTYLLKFSNTLFIEGVFTYFTLHETLHVYPYESFICQAHIFSIYILKSPSGCLSFYLLPFSQCFLLSSLYFLLRSLTLSLSLSGIASVNSFFSFILKVWAEALPT